MNDGFITYTFDEGVILLESADPKIIESLKWGYQIISDQLCFEKPVMVMHDQDVKEVEILYPNLSIVHENVLYTEALNPSAFLANNSLINCSVGKLTSDVSTTEMLAVITFLENQSECKSFNEEHGLVVGIVNDKNTNTS